jgi:hypothetical protein
MQCGWTLFANMKNVDEFHWNFSDNIDIQFIHVIDNVDSKWWMDKILCLWNCWHKWDWPYMQNELHGWTMT